MEVFLFVSSDDEIPLLEQSLYAWEHVEYAFPVNSVQVRKSRFEIERRVLADQMAKDSHYVLADIGCVPEDGRALLGIMGRMKANDGLIGFADGDSPSIVPEGIRVCRRGIVHRWPAQQTPSYDAEHAEAVKQAGFKVSIWPTIFKRLLAC